MARKLRRKKSAGKKCAGLKGKGRLKKGYRWGKRGGCPIPAKKKSAGRRKLRRRRKGRALAGLGDRLKGDLTHCIEYGRSKKGILRCILQKKTTGKSKHSKMARGRAGIKRKYSYSTSARRRLTMSRRRGTGLRKHRARQKTA